MLRIVNGSIIDVLKFRRGM